MSKLLILNGLGCPVFLYSYDLLEIFNKKTGHPHGENAYLIDFKEEKKISKSG